jgi:hypothetical protein
LVFNNFHSDTHITFFFGYTVKKYLQRFQKFDLSYGDLYPKPEQDTNDWELETKR